MRERKAPAQTPEAPTTPPTAAPKHPLREGELATMMAEAQKLHGAPVIRAAELKPQYKHIPTGVFTLDIGLHGGFPEGAIALMYGRASSGKTTIAMRTMANAQRKYPDMASVFVDIEGTYQPEWGEKHGIDNARMLLIQPTTGEQALDLACAAISAGEVSIITVDSLAALTPGKELEKSMEDLTVGEQGRLIARFCRASNSRLNQEKTRGHRPAMLWINQWRQKIGVMFGDPRVLPGGEAQHYFASTKVEFKNREIMGKDDEGRPIPDHNIHSFKIDKNKVGTGIREGEFKMVRNPDSPLGMGFMDEAQTVVNWARKEGAITGAGSSWHVDGVETKFGRLQEIADYFYSDLEFYDHFQHRLICDYREKCKVAPREYL